MVWVLWLLLYQKGPMRYGQQRRKTGRAKAMGWEGHSTGTWRINSTRERQARGQLRVRKRLEIPLWSCLCYLRHHQHVPKHCHVLLCFTFVQPVSSPRMQASQVARLFSSSAPPSLFMPKLSANMKKVKGKKEGQGGRTICLSASGVKVSKR